MCAEPASIACGLEFNSQSLGGRRLGQISLEGPLPLILQQHPTLHHFQETAIVCYSYLLARSF